MLPEIINYAEINLDWNHLQNNLETSDTDNIVKMYFYFKRQNIDIDSFEFYNHLISKGISHENADRLCRNLLFLAIKEETNLNIIDISKPILDEQIKEGLK